MEPTIVFESCKYFFIVSAITCSYLDLLVVLQWLKSLYLCVFVDSLKHLLVSQVSVYRHASLEITKCLHIAHMSQ